MKKVDTIEFITRLFHDLSKTSQVEVITQLYFEMNDYQKDEFLRKTI